MPSYLTSVVLEWNSESLATEYLTNPTFDTDITGWTEVDAAPTMTPTHDTSFYRSGGGSLKLVDSALEDDYMRASFTGLAGVTYNVRAWVNTTAYSGGFTLLLAHDVTAAVVKEHRVAAGTSGWELRQVYITPATTGAVSVRLYACIGTLFWDDVSVGVWTTVDNNEIRDIEWWAGIDREGNDPEPGGMRVTLKNVARKWEPLFGANTIDTQQRFRLTVNGTQEGVWYTESFDLDYPDGQDFSWVTIGCGDGQSILALDDLSSMDPPEAESYEDVVNFYEPWGYWRLGEAEGTQARPRIIRGFKGKGKKRRKFKRRRGTTYTTREEAGAVAGASGIYKNNPSLAEQGVIVGDTDTCVLFESARSQYVRVPVEVEDLIDNNRLTVTAWINAASVHPSNGNGIVSGPYSATPTESAWRLSTIDDAGDIGIVGVIQLTSGSTVVCRSTDEGAFITLDDWYFAAMTWDGHALRVYLDGVEVNTSGEYGTLRSGSAGQDFLIGSYTFTTSSPAGFFNGYIDEVAVWERVLSADAIANLYTTATARGYPQQTSGERVAALADSTLWADTSIQTTGRDVLPIMHFGQGKLEELAETAHAEGPRSLFFFNGAGDPVYLGFEWPELNANYNTVQATFTDDGTGEPYQDVQLEYDFETFNEVLASHESGESVTVTDSTESDKRGRRVNSEYTDLLLVEHMNVEELAAVVLDYYKSPSKRPVTLTVDGHHSLTQILDLDIGHMIRVKKSGETGNPTDRIANIIGKRKMIDTAKHLTCTYTLSRGWPADEGEWLLGIAGFTEIGQTTVVA